MDLDGNAVRSLVEREYAAFDGSGRDMPQLGSIMEERIGIMQHTIREALDKKGGSGATDIGLRELCFRACKAWKRDYSKSILDDVGETLVWMKRWARRGDVQFSG